MADVLKVRSEYRLQEWTEIIRQCQNSGLSNKAFCQQNGISEKSYYYWLRKLRNTLAESNVPQLVQLESAPDVVPDSMIHIQFRGASMDLPGTTDVEAIAAVLRSLQSL